VQLAILILGIALLIIGVEVIAVGWTGKKNAIDIYRRHEIIRDIS